MLGEELWDWAIKKNIFKKCWYLGIIIIDEKVVLKINICILNNNIIGKLNSFKK